MWNQKTLQHNSKTRVVFINSCNFLVFSVGEHRVVCLTSSIKNWQFWRHSYNTTAVVENIENKKIKTASTVITKDLSVLVINTLYSSYVFLTWILFTRRWDTPLCLKIECRLNFTIKLSLLVWSSLRYTMWGGNHIHTNCVKSHYQRKGKLDCSHTQMGDFTSAPQHAYSLDSKTSESGALYAPVQI